MLHLHFGNRLEPLADALAGELERAWKDPLDPPPVVVPAPPVGQWLKYRLAARGRTLLNLPTIALETFLWDALEPAAGDAILRVEALSHAVARVLDGSLVFRPEFAAPRRFLVREDGEIDPVRRSQLAREMARHFLEYEYNRPSVWKAGGWIRDGIDRSWPARPWFGGERDAAGEEWQRILHGKVFGPSGPLSESRLMGLPRLHRARREGGWEPGKGDVFLFSVDKTSHFHRNLLLELSETREVRLFLANPCMEFWEDLDTSRRGPAKGARRLPLRRLTGEEYLSPEVPPDFWKEEADPELLKLWGRTSRENTVLWSQAAHHDFEDHSEDPVEAGASLLSRLQSDLLRRDPGPLLGVDPEEPADDDGSVRILAVPEAVREWEAVRDAVLQWLSEDPSRRPSDAVVLLPDPASRAHEIEAVFGGPAPGDPGRIPWAVLGARGGSSRWSQGARILLELWREGVDRRRLLALARNPLSRRRRGLTESDIAPWAEWARGSGILSGWDASDRRSRGEVADLASDVHTVRAGLARLAAAAFADEPVDLGLEPGAGLLPAPWRDRDSSDPRALDQFLSFCDDLRSDLDSPPCGSLREQGVKFLALCDAWLDPVGDPVEEAQQRGLAEAVDSFGLRGPDPVDPAELAEALEPVLDGELPGASAAFGGALTFAPLRPGHIVPHGLVVVSGLDESFPGQAQSGSLDLLSRHRILGDSDAVADNRHAFLLALLSARDRLVLSWTSRDLRKDAERAPSSVVLELESALRRGYLGGLPGSTPLRRGVPLLARTGGVLEGDPPAWEVPSWDPADKTESVACAEGASLPRAAEPDLDDLRSFLGSPFLSRIRTRPGWIPDEGDEPAAPLFPRNPALHGLCAEVLDAIWRGSDGERAAEDVLRSRAWDDGVPEGGFLGAALGRFREWAASVASGSSEFRERSLRRGLPDLLPPGTRWPPGVPQGAVRWSARGAEGEIVLADLVPFSGSAPRPERKARLFLAGAALRAAGPAPVRLLWIERMGRGRCAPEALPERADADWIADLAAAWADPSRTEHLPLSVAAAKGSTRAEMEDAFDNERRFRDELELLLEPAFPTLPGDGIVELADRLFAPWRLG